MTLASAAPTWRDQTLSLLKHRPASLTIKQIAADIDVSEDWLTKFARNATQDVGIEKVQRLYSYLKNYTPKGI